MSQAVHASQSATQRKRQVPPGEGERRVVQYGPEWMEHVANGGDVRDGNILIGSPARRPARPKRTGKRP